MAGLGLFLYGAVKAAFGIGKAIDNQQMKNYTYKIDDQGRPTWMDRNCNDYINGEKVVAKAVTRADGSVKLQQVGQRSGSVYFDPDVARNNKMDERTRFELERAKQYGDLAYNRWYPQYQRCLTTEISTGKIIAALYKEECSNIYRKFYLKNMPVSKYSSTEADPGDFGVPISKEEHRKLNILCGTFRNTPTYEVLKMIGTDQDPYKDVHPE